MTTVLNTFAILAASTVTNTGPSIIKGNVGVSPGTSITGFPPGSATELLNPNQSLAGQAKGELDALWDVLRVPDRSVVDLTGKDLGGMSLEAGIYKFSSSVGLTGTLKLTDNGDPNATFVFHIGSTLITATNASVIVSVADLAERIFWLVGSSATLGTGTNFAGKILAYASITANHGAAVKGALWARTGAVTLNDNVVEV